MKRIFWWLSIIILANALPVHAQEDGKERSKVIQTTDGIQFYLHTVQRGQNLYNIARMYHTDMDLIIRLNPSIREGMKRGDVLKIPVNTREFLEMEQRKAQQQAAPPPEPPPAELPCGQDTARMKPVYHVALLMHFFLDDVDSLNLFNLPENPEAAYRPFQFLQFYEGFMMAVDSMQKLGLNAVIHVYDVSPDTARTRKFLSGAGLDQMDLIITLLYNRTFQMVARYARQHNIPIVSPVSEREAQLAGNPMVIKIRPGTETLYPETARVISSAFPDARIVIAREPQGRFTAEAAELGRLCQERNLNVVVTDSHVMVDFLEQERPNLVVIFSDSKSEALDLLTQLNGIKSQYDLTVFGLPLWGRIDGMEIEYLVNLRTHMASHYFIDYHDPDVKRFTQAFQDQIKTDPDVLAFAGFDAGFYFLHALMLYGTGFPDCMNGMHLKLLHLNPEYIQTPGNGYENSHWMFYYYENYDVYPMTGR